MKCGARSEEKRILIAHFVEVADDKDQIGGVGLLWDPWSRMLHARIKAPTKSGNAKMDGFLNKFLLQGGRRFAKIWQASWATKAGERARRCTASGKRSDAKSVDPNFLPDQIFWIDRLRDGDSHDFDLDDWERAPLVRCEPQERNPAIGTFKLAELPTSGDPKVFIENLIDGHNKPLPEWTLARRGDRIRVEGPRPSVEARLGIKGRRSASMLRTIRHGQKHSSPPPTHFERFTNGRFDGDAD